MRLPQYNTESGVYVRLLVAFSSVAHWHPVAECVDPFLLYNGWRGEKMKSIASEVPLDVGSNEFLET